MGTGKNRIKPLVKKMTRGEVEELCSRKEWSLIDFKTAKSFSDSIPYDVFWVDGNSEDAYSGKDGDVRPNIAFKKGGDLIMTTCHPICLQNCVVLRKEQTIMSAYRAMLSLIEGARNIEDITRPEISVLSRIEAMLHELINARGKHEGQKTGSDQE